MPSESDSINALVKVFSEIGGLIHRLLEITSSSNAILQGRGYTGRLNDAANERAAQRTDIQLATADRHQIVQAIGKLDVRMSKMEETQREILYHVTPRWQRRQKWWKVTRGNDG